MFVFIYVVIIRSFDSQKGLSPCLVNRGIRAARMWVHRDRDGLA